ncbi:MAG TPA: dihydrodipicolinate reductase C-terminal domain-containing protein [Terriglobales bacterium]|nr:dihydrodipicolinate reductase C-terminal domain-containing protein [Terriglobales bacterium]
MRFLLLGYGKTGSLVEEVAHERGHKVRVLRSGENLNGKALSAETLRDEDVVIDFTNPGAAVHNMEACARAGKSIVVGTTGWYGEIPRIKALAEKSGIGVLYGGNFSIGVNLFFEVARTAATALKHKYSGQIFERHHAHKKDAPSGTAMVLRDAVREVSGTELEITSFREGDVVGLHELVLNSSVDKIYLCHDAKSRRGFAEGAVRGAEWLTGKKGFFNFKDIWREL